MDSPLEGTGFEPSVPRLTLTVELGAAAGPRRDGPQVRISPVEEGIRTLSVPARERVGPFGGMGTVTEAKEAVSKPQPILRGTEGSKPALVRYLGDSPW
jgi:hypothetical protein